MWVVKAHKPPRTVSLAEMCCAAPIDSTGRSNMKGASNSAPLGEGSTARRTAATPFQTTHHQTLHMQAQQHKSLAYKNGRRNVQI
jgi:hypothetical protein